MPFTKFRTGVPVTFSYAEKLQYMRAAKMPSSNRLI